MGILLRSKVNSSAPQVSDPPLINSATGARGFLSITGVRVACPGLTARPWLF